MLKLKELEDVIQEGKTEPEDNRSMEELYDLALKTVSKAGKASTSYIQRVLKIGYIRATRIIDLLEKKGVIGPAIGAKPRKVLVRPERE